MIPVSGKMSLKAGKERRRTLPENYGEIIVNPGGESGVVYKCRMPCVLARIENGKAVENYLLSRTKVTREAGQRTILGIKPEGMKNWKGGFSGEIKQKDKKRKSTTAPLKPGEWHVLLTPEPVKYTNEGKWKSMNGDAVLKPLRFRIGNKK